MLRNLVSGKPFLSFIFLTFLISWGAILLIFGPENIPVTQDMQEMVGMTILLGPTLTSLILIGIYGGGKAYVDLLKRLIRWKIHYKWHLIALLTAPMSTLLSVFLFSLFVPYVTSAIANVDSLSNLVVLALVGGISIGLFEELGWTGFATPVLLKKQNFFVSGIMIGLVWGAWHFILFWEEYSFNKLIPLMLLLVRLFAWLPAYRILMTWVYSNTESLFINILMHTSLVASLVLFDPIAEGLELIVYILIRAGVLWALVGYLYSRRNRVSQNNFI